MKDERRSGKKTSNKKMDLVYFYDVTHDTFLISFFKYLYLFFTLLEGFYSCYLLVSLV